MWCVFYILCVTSDNKYWFEVKFQSEPVFFNISASTGFCLMWYKYYIFLYLENNIKYVNVLF